MRNKASVSLISLISPISFNLQFTVLLVLTILALYSCSGPKSVRIKEDTNATLATVSIEQPASRPVALVVERSFSGPFYGIALETPGTLRSSVTGFVYLIDQGSQRVLKLDSSFEAVAEIGGSGAFRNFFDTPTALALNERFVYVTDSERDLVHRLDLDLRPVDALEFEDSADGLKYGDPSGLAVSSDEVLWVVDVARKRVALFDRYFAFQEFLADYNMGGYSLRQPGSALALSSGVVALCDQERGEIALFGEFGAELGMIGAGILRQPTDICEGANGELWIADSELGEIVCLSQEGELLFRTSQTGSVVELHKPAGICTLPDNRLLISDQSSNQLLLCRVFYQSDSE